MEYYFLSSSHLEDRIWFRDDADFKVGMNYVAVAAAHCETSVVAFVLMSNHVHFVLLGTNEDEMRKFYSYYKMLYSRYVRSRYGISRFLRENSLDCQLIPPVGERLERVIAYVLMNPVAANICLYPTGYPWGCGNCFFSEQRIKGRPIRSVGYRERRRVLHTNLPFGPTAVLGEDGYILPESFVRKDIGEAIFRKASRLEYFIRTSPKARQTLESENAVVPSFKDQSIAAMVYDICFSLFRKSRLSELEETERQRVIYEIHRRSGADNKQLARVLELPPAKVVEYLSKY